jgi:hypothetical protein
LTRLQVLKLASNSEYVDKYIQISLMKNLIYLDLSQNRLEYFTSFPTNLNYLILSNNRIKSLSFYKPDVLKKLDVKGRPQTSSTLRVLVQACLISLLFKRDAAASLLNRQKIEISDFKLFVYIDLGEHEF